MSLLNQLGARQVSGDVVAMKRTDARHLDADGKAAPLGREERDGFARMGVDVLGDVSGQLNESQALFQRMITNPDSVDIHDVTIAMAKAEMSLNLTKAVVDRSVKAYNDIINFR